MKIRFLAALLILLTIAATVGCSKGGTTDSIEDSSSETATTDFDFYSQFPEDIDYQGYEFVIMGWTDYLNLWFPDEESNNELSVALYDRNETISNLLNIELTRSNAPYHMDAAYMIEEAVLSNLCPYDLSVQNAIYSAPASLRNVFHNLYNLPYCDFTQEWWPQQCVEEMTFQNKMFSVSSYATYSGLYESYVVFYNKDLAEDCKVTADPYTMVDNMEWTIDNMLSSVKDVYEDINTDMIRDYRDVFGFTVAYSRHASWYAAAEVSLVTKNEHTGGLEVGYDITRMDQLVETLAKYYYGSNEGILLTHPHMLSQYEDNNMNIFRDNHCIYTMGPLHAAVNTYRYTGLDYGILPLPMLDENQESYHTFTDDYVVTVPSTATNLEQISIVLEMLSYEGYYGVTEVFFDTTMKVKLTEEDNDRRMLDIINNTRTMPFEFVYDNFIGFSTCLSNIFTQNDGYRSFSGYFDEKITTVRQHYIDVAKGFEKSGN